MQTIAITQVDKTSDRDDHCCAYKVKCHAYKSPSGHF